MVVDVPAADVPAVFLLEDVHLPAGEAAEEDAQFGVPEIDEEHISGILGVKIVLPENTVIQSNGG